MVLVPMSTHAQYINWVMIGVILISLVPHCGNPIPALLNDNARLALIRTWHCHRCWHWHRHRPCQVNSHTSLAANALGSLSGVDDCHLSTVNCQPPTARQMRGQGCFGNFALFDLQHGIIFMKLPLSYCGLPLLHAFKIWSQIKFLKLGMKGKRYRFDKILARFSTTRFNAIKS